MTATRMAITALSGIPLSMAAALIDIQIFLTFKRVVDREDTAAVGRIKSHDAIRRRQQMKWWMGG